MPPSTVSFLVENQPGVLFKVSNLFRRRGFNIDSITVGALENSNYSRMTITVDADAKTLHNLIEQLDKLISSPRVPRKLKLRAMEVLIKTIGTCYGIVSDVEVEMLEDELKGLKEEDRRAEAETGEAAIGYTIEEDPTK